MDAPATFQEAATLLAEASESGRTVRLRGGGTKLDWGNPTPAPELEITSAKLDRIAEHNAGDLTAVLEAGVPLATAQQRFAAEGQMLALDPPLGDAAEATVGGIVAAGDSGPLRHRYGTPRDLVIGITVALADGTVARSGGKVIKNVAGYDLAKLFAGSMGTLGMILSLAVRLHPLPPATTTALGASGSPESLARAAQLLAASPLELDALDVAWRFGRGGILARLSGADPERRAARAIELMRETGLEQLYSTSEDERLWDRQREGQRSASGALVRVSARPSRLPEVIAAAEACAATLVGRAALGTSFLELDPDAVARLRESLPPGSRSVLLDSPAELRQSVEPWGDVDPALLELTRRVKLRFDPASTCNPGLFVGGI